MRDDFSTATKNTLAGRVGMRCSNPKCRKLTIGPADEQTKSVSIGVGAHITAASPNGPRYDASLLPIDRSSIQNGIWLCQNCAKIIDSDVARFSADVLRRWKREAEVMARMEVDRASGLEHTSSILELISLAELRAEAILQDMKKRNARAVVEYSTGSWHEMTRPPWWARLLSMIRGRSVLDLPERRPRAFARSTFHSNEGPHLDSRHPWLRIESKDELSLLLEDLVDSFRRLHDAHLRALRSGQYVVAHDLVVEIHKILDEYRTLSSFPQVFGMSSHRYMLDFGSIERGKLIDEHFVYPGAIHRELRITLPQSLRDDYFVPASDHPFTNWRWAEFLLAEKADKEWQEWTERYAELRANSADAAENR